MFQEKNLSFSNQLYRRLSVLRWLALALGLLLILLHMFLEETIEKTSPEIWEYFEFGYGIFFSVATWALITWLLYSIRQTITAEHALNQTLVELRQANQHLEFLLQLNRRVSVAEDDASLAEIITDAFMSETPAVACSLIRFDAQRRTLPANYRIKGRPIMVDNQTAHVSMTEAHQQYQACTNCGPEDMSDYPLFAPPIPLPTVKKLHCLEMARGDHVYGILSLYLQDADYPNSQEQLLLEMMANEVTLAMESCSLRTREMDIFDRLQKARRTSNQIGELTGVLATTVEALEADGGLLFLTDEKSSDLQLEAEAGESLDDTLDLVKGLAKGAGYAEKPLIIDDLEQDGSSEIRSLLIAPLRVTDQHLGSLVLWSARPDAFTRRRAQLVATVAGQTALFIENQQLYLRGEYQAALAERTRLAREIHDGLAQTLGYLKLRTAQIGSWLERGDDRRAKTALAETQKLLDEAYVDTREAIDGLRLSADVHDLQAWVQEIASEFEALSGIPVSIMPAPDISPPPSISIQLQRIVQEAFSNIRKHADATRAWLDWQHDECSLTLRIRDNGHGFDVDEFPLLERHGLRIMRERTEMLDAEFQVASQEDKGTEIIVRLPLKEYSGEMQNE